MGFAKWMFAARASPNGNISSIVYTSTNGDSIAYTGTDGCNKVSGHIPDLSDSHPWASAVTHIDSIPTKAKPHVFTEYNAKLLAHWESSE